METNIKKIFEKIVYKAMIDKNFRKNCLDGKEKNLFIDFNLNIPKGISINFEEKDIKQAEIEITDKNIKIVIPKVINFKNELTNEELEKISGGAILNINNKSLCKLISILNFVTLASCSNNLGPSKAESPTRALSSASKELDAQKAVLAVKKAKLAKTKEVEAEAKQVAEEAAKAAAKAVGTPEAEKKAVEAELAIQKAEALSEEVKVEERSVNELEKSIILGVPFIDVPPPLPPRTPKTPPKLPKRIYDHFTSTEQVTGEIGNLSEKLKMINDVNQEIDEITKIQNQLLNLFKRLEFILKIENIKIKELKSFKKADDSNKECLKLLDEITRLKKAEEDLKKKAEEAKGELDKKKVIAEQFAAEIITLKEIVKAQKAEEDKFSEILKQNLFSKVKFKIEERTELEEKCDAAGKSKAAALKAEEETERKHKLAIAEIETKYEVNLRKMNTSYDAVKDKKERALYALKSAMEVFAKDINELISATKESGPIKLVDVKDTVVIQGKPTVSKKENLSESDMRHNQSWDDDEKEGAAVDAQISG